MQTGPIYVGRGERNERNVVQYVHSVRTYDGLSSSSSDRLDSSAMM